MSEISADTYQSIPSRYYSQESSHSHFYDETRRVEEIIEEEKKRETAAAEELERQNAEREDLKLRAAEEIKTEEVKQQQEKTEEDYLERLRAAAAEEINRWLDSERIKSLENTRKTMEEQILDDLKRENMINDLNPPDLSEYIQNEKIIPGSSINLLA